MTIAKFFFKNFGIFFKCFCESSSKKLDFAHRLDAVARPGSRELRAVKIPASYDVARPPKRRKNNSEKLDFFWSRKSVFYRFGEVLEELRPNGRQNQLQRQIFRQIVLF